MRPFEWLKTSETQQKKTYCKICDEETHTEKQGKLAICQACRALKGLYYED